MASQSQEASRAIPQHPKMSRREARAHRILDAAAALILRWGYNKTSLDDISREAGVAKGTLYLHWKTREDLFGALIKREKIALAHEIKQHIAEDPADSTLRGILKYATLTLMKRPLMKAILLRDMDVLGKLAQTNHGSDMYAKRLLGFTAYIELLREQNLVRTDLSIKAEVYMLSAIFTGFFLVAPFIPEEFMVSDEEIADLMAETIHCTLEPGNIASSGALQAASHTFMDYLDRSTTIAQEQFQQELAAKPSKREESSR